MTTTPPAGSGPAPRTDPPNTAGPGAPAPNTLGPRVVALGGGHGLASTLQAARLYASEVTAVVSVADDGGSSGRLRQIAGIPAPGDLRRCLVAMAEDGSLWSSAFEYRFPSGDLEGHALGNLIIAGLANVTGDFGQALHVAASLLGSVGRVLPATEIPVVLKADVAGTEVVGQSNVSESDGAISSVSIVPPDAPVPKEVQAAIAEADQIVIGPGSLFTSVLAVCAVPGIRQALTEHRKGEIIYVCNLRPQFPETANYDAADHLRAVLDHGVPVDVMVAHREQPADPAIPSHIETHGVPTIVAPLSNADGTAHDPGLLALALRSLT